MSLVDDSPKVVLFTDQQWDDIASFCCNDIHGHKAILYVDVTFQLGSFFVLVTSYQNTIFATVLERLVLFPIKTALWLKMILSRLLEVNFQINYSTVLPGFDVLQMAKDCDEYISTKNRLSDILSNEPPVRVHISWHTWALGPIRPSIAHTWRGFVWRVYVKFRSPFLSFSSRFIVVSLRCLAAGCLAD